MCQCKMTVFTEKEPNLSPNSREPVLQNVHIAIDVGI